MPEPRVLPVTAEVKKIARSYDASNLSIGIVGSQCAEPLAIAGRAAGFRTIFLGQKGRDAYYTRENAHLFDEVFALPRWDDALKPDIVAKLVALNAILMPNRAMVPYWKYDGIETVPVPMFGNRGLICAEERDRPYNQYFLMDEAGIKRPREFKNPAEIDRKVVVKAQNVKNPKDRAFTFPSTPQEYDDMMRANIALGIATEEAYRKARIEEFWSNRYYNANFHVYSIDGISQTGYDFVGNGDREQIEGTGEELGHRGKTTRESFVYTYFEVLQKMLKVAAAYYPPGLRGPVGIQGAWRADADGNPEYGVFDWSFRGQGDPPMGPTSPQMRNLRLKHAELLKLHRMTIEDPFDLIMLELKEAARRERLPDTVT